MNSSRYKVRSINAIYRGYRFYALPRRVWIYTVDGKKDIEVADDIMRQIYEELGDEIVGTDVEEIINGWKIENGYDE